MEKKYNVDLADSLFKDFETIPSKSLAQILGKIELLENFPEMGSVCLSPKWEGYRQLVIEQYTVLYKVEKAKKLVVIYFAKHGRMNFR